MFTVDSVFIDLQRVNMSCCDLRVVHEVMLNSSSPAHLRLLTHKEMFLLVHKKYQTNEDYMFNSNTDKHTSVISILFVLNIVLLSAVMTVCIINTLKNT